MGMWRLKSRPHTNSVWCSRVSSNGFGREKSQILGGGGTIRLIERLSLCAWALAQNPDTASSPQSLPAETDPSTMEM